MDLSVSELYHNDGFGEFNFLSSLSFSAGSCSTFMPVLWVFLGYLRGLGKCVTSGSLYCDLFRSQAEFGETFIFNIRKAK